MKRNLHTIAPHLPFASTLARWVLERYGDEPVELSRVLLLLPSRRACLALREAFAQASGDRPLLLPRMQPLGDVDEDVLLTGAGVPPAQLRMPPFAFDLKRRFILARLIQNKQPARLDHALTLAGELAHLLDELAREKLSLDHIRALVPESFAQHWQVTVEFLQILSEHWPRIAEEEGLASPEECRGAMLSALSAHWRQSMPADPVIAAGTTGSIPATAELLAAIAALPRGHIVLPGLDLEADDEYFEHLGESHPQWGMRQLLAKLGCERSQVEAIGGGSSPRTKLLREIMRPAEVSQAWQHLDLPLDEALAGLTRVDCAGLQEEATAIALMLRETLEQPQKTAALITHDRMLARHVASLMQRFGVTLDDSAGLPLMQTPAASFLRLILEALAGGNAPVALLSLLKHPLTHAGMERIACLEAARTLEVEQLRGSLRRPLAALRELTQAQDVRALLQQLSDRLAPLERLLGGGGESNLSLLVAAHLECAEALAGEALWNGPEADALAEFFTELREASPGAPPLSPDTYPAVFETLLSGKIFRPEYGMHPRLKILSPIEARMQSFDRVILGGLNEASWPPEIIADPWFNREMRLKVGLPAPERRIGQAAHDFCMLASAPEVILTRAEKVGNAPATPSRWLTKLDVLLSRFAAQATLADTRWNGWAQSLDAPEAVQASAPPEPRPPLTARPREISVTQVETWLRDPYAIYAAQILRLKKLKPLGEDPGGADFGTAVHAALERFTRAFPQALPPDAYARLLGFGNEMLAPLFFNATVKALWWPRFERIAAWIIEQEHARRHGIDAVLTEKDGVLRLEDFLLRGRADRIEEGRDGMLSIIDYKTGSLPPARDIKAGLSSQLVLLALIFTAEKNLPASKIGDLEYWQLRGGEDAGKTMKVAQDKIPEYLEEAKAGLARLIETYRNPDFPYRAAPIPSRSRRVNDYEHLARIKEWG